MQATRRWFAKFESLLDEGASGPLWLKNELLAAEIAESLHNRDGRSFWEGDSFDHYVRSDDEWERIVAYVLKQSGKGRICKTLDGMEVESSSRGASSASM